MSFDYGFTPSRGPSRNDCARQGHEVIAIVARGGYTAPSGKSVDLAAAVRAAKDATVEYRPDDDVAPPSTSRGYRTRLSVVNGTCLASARAIAGKGAVPFVLNFASAKNPGGGFLGGARAQEESIARSSALYACIEGRGMYEHHRNMKDCMYSSWMIWSPDVPVFRDDETSALLEEPYPCAILTAPAPNAKVVLDRDPSRAEEVDGVMRSRVARSLAIASAHRCTHLVLGAWGCGVFGNDPAIVADAFHRELEGPFAGVFEEIVFAVLDWSNERRFIRPFAERFARWSR